MTNLPDSGWLAAIHKVAWWVSAAIATAAAMVLALAYFDAPWFGQLPVTLAHVIGVVGVLFFCLFVFRVIDLTWHAVKKSRCSRVSRRFNRLSDQQREFLLKKFQCGSRGFSMPESTGLPRWLEELENWNYIKQYFPSISSSFWVQITEAGWQQLEKHQDKSN